MAVARRDEKRAGKPKAINCKNFRLWTAGQETKDMCIQVQHIRLCVRVYKVQIFIFMHHCRRVPVCMCTFVFPYLERCVSRHSSTTYNVHVYHGMSCVLFFVACMQIIDTLPVVIARCSWCFVVWSPFSTHISTTTALQR
jgi:hypothetical protein